MIKFHALHEIMEYAVQTHGSHLFGPKGVNCYSSLRRSNGKKIIFSITKGSHITKQEVVGDDSLVIQYYIKGTIPRGNVSLLSHHIHLADLRMVNVYEAFTEYLTVDKIDFMYVIKGGPKFTLLSALEILPPPKVLAQWVYKDEELTSSLEYLGKTVVLERKEPPLNLDFS